MFWVEPGTEPTQIGTDPEPNRNFRSGFSLVLRKSNPNRTRTVVQHMLNYLFKINKYLKLIIKLKKMNNFNYIITYFIIKCSINC